MSSPSTPLGLRAGGAPAVAGGAGSPPDAVKTRCRKADAAITLGS
jgi:hypothetical protein